MRTAKCVATVLVAALVGIAALPTASGQDNTARQPSNTRTADCLVKITVDPSVLPLNMETLEGLLHSSAVQGKAMTEALGPGAAADRHEIIFIEWLSESARSKRARTRQPSGMSEDMLKEMEEIYGREYAQMMGMQAGTSEEKGKNADDSQGDGRKAPKEPDKRNSPRSDMKSGGAAGGMMGGAGGMGGGGMGVGMGGLGMMGKGMRGMQGMGGMGMMGGGMGMGGLYGAPTASESTSTVECSVVVRLTVALPDELKPFAKELLDALVVNLRNCLLNTHNRYAKDLEELLDSARQQQDRALERLKETGGSLSADGARVKKQLDTIVDLSVLSPQTPVGEAIEVLKNAVNPPVQIVALWRDLFEQASVEPSTPIEIDGMPSIRLGTTLDLLVKGMSDPLPGAPPVVYRIRDNVVVIGTSATLGMSNTSATGAMTQADIRALAAQKNELARAIQSLELDLVSMEARRKAMYMQMEEVRQQADKRLAADTVTRELEKLVQMNTTNLKLLEQRVITGQMAEADLASAQESAARARIELARRREELAKLTGGGRIEQYDSELSKMTIDEAENRARLEVLRKQLDEVQRQLMQASIFDPEAARARIAQETLDLANRRVGELEARMATLQPPTVIMIGAN